MLQVRWPTSDMLHPELFNLLSLHFHSTLTQLRLHSYCTPTLLPLHNFIKQE